MRESLCIGGRILRADSSSVSYAARRRQREANPRHRQHLALSPSPLGRERPGTGAPGLPRGGDGGSTSAADKEIRPDAAERSHEGLDAAPRVL